MLWLISIFKWVLYSTALASVLSLIILLFKILFKEKLGVRWHYAIWLILIIRLLIPYGPQSSLSVFNIFKFSDENPTQIQYTLKNETTGKMQNYNEEKLAENNKNLIGKENATASKDKTTLRSSLAILWKNIIKIKDSPVNLQLISCSWLLGVIIIAAYTIIMTVKLKNKLKNQHICVNQEFISLLLQCKNKLNLKSNIKIINTNLVKTPCVFGFVKPKLLLPIDIENCLNRDELEFVILHELAHIKRKDILVSSISCALQIIHWFNPIIWYSFYRMRNDKELACDALALSYINSNDYINYGKTIIKLLESYKKTIHTYGMACIINDKSQIKRRVTMISKFKKNSYKWSIIPILALTLMGGIMLTNAKNNPVLADNKKNPNLETNKISSDQSKTKENIITEHEIIGKHFKGKMLMVPGGKKIVVGVNNDISKNVKTTSQIAKENKAICAINAGAFTDDLGNGFSPTGLIMHNGKVIFNDLEDNAIKTGIVAFTDKGILLVGNYSLNELKNLNTTEAVSFGPALIVNGKPTIKDGSEGGMGMAPRTAIGQKADGTVIMLTIDGRSVESLGATLLDVQNILLEHGAYNASNLDGGSSSSMYYNGKVINNPSDSKGERVVVSTFMVLP
ncbi:M56 and phosphodiester glycosidase domain-containing protein [Clostridium sp. FP1]|uniref:M56 and phosphodiester glycosidase domain-containing protein n=1 Tax=Clostridium sp. FP1 TaxID=2724076 RepID=UPI001CCFF3CA|nr:M56 and phosphodiester glycosidase domain-containing protein [Clostridium sp. FP1]MBZ9634790.1 M56 and phosphodiester glycosidase domain-containing protein [Clostridium sp. FP1]